MKEQEDDDNEEMPQKDVSVLLTIFIFTFAPSNDSTIGTWIQLFQMYGWQTNWQ